jgi:hypothetical protein
VPTQRALQAQVQSTVKFNADFRGGSMAVRGWFDGEFTLENIQNTRANLPP